MNPLPTRKLRLVDAVGHALYYIEEVKKCGFGAKTL